MAEHDLWEALPDEPIGAIVERIVASEPEIAALVTSPRHELAFRTFAYIRVGLVLGEALVGHDVAPEASRTWVDQILADPAHYDAVVAEVRAVAQDVAADPALADADAAPDPAARERFVRFLRESRGN